TGPGVRPAYAARVIAVHADAHDLRSFPTRRSSDLRCRRPAHHHPAADLALPLYAPADRARLRVPGPATAVQNQVVKVHVAVLDRSEEHRSELQSPFDFPFRLLLAETKAAPVNRNVT